LGYTDLRKFFYKKIFFAYYLLSLTQGQRKYFYSNIIKLPGNSQQNFLWRNLIKILDTDLFFNDKNPINYDWDLISCIKPFNKDLRLGLSEWGILSPIDILESKLNVKLLTSYLFSTFFNVVTVNYNVLSQIEKKNKVISLISRFLFEIYLQFGHKKEDTVFLQETQGFENQFFESTYDFNNFLFNNLTNRITFEETFGLNYSIIKVAIGQASSLLLITFLLKPFLVLPRNNLILAILNPVMELFNIIAAAVYFMDPIVRLGVRVQFKFVLRTTKDLKNSSISNFDPANEQESYSEDYINLILGNNVPADYNHSLFADQLWLLATNIDPNNSIVIRETISTSSHLIVNSEDFVSDLKTTLSENLKEEYVPFHQVLGCRFHLIFNSGINATTRSLLLNRIDFLSRMVGYYSTYNGLKATHMPDKDIYLAGHVRSPFMFSSNSQLIVNYIKQKLALETILYAVKLKKKNFNAVINDLKNFKKKII